ncbi:neutral alpha-glucosidase AB-like isoform X2 [Paramacrobiotus metropolitanus]|uniref:neutral alpha-glucosidase AB-like isoform X2 n=1 Tax=Paramacrobiotus metropolitanus TaxID=2943436 RepID=UPI0024457E2C|nr:neutral alpha-glucosidase AB-like isoform X2 [Paramacrobiotus metropolitanus]
MLPTWRITFAFISFSLFYFVSAVDRGNFKTCNDARFCRKHRALKSDEFVHELLIDTLQLSSDGSTVSATVRNVQNNEDLLLEIFALKDRSMRFKINEKTPSRKRYEVDMSLDQTPALSTLSMAHKHGQVQITLPDSLHITVTPKPFRIDIYEEGTILVTLNSANLFLMEAMKPRPSKFHRFVSWISSLVPEPDKPVEEHEEVDQEHENPDEQAQQADEHKEEEPKEQKQDEPWEESFKGHTDTRPFGGQSLGMDISFIGFDNLYGVPEHADTLRLKSTKQSGDPYRLYNLDVFEYELWNGMALYGAIPFIMAHNEKNTVGVFWNNAAETWIDVDYTTASHGGSTLFGAASTPKADTHWISEAGIVDLFVFMGPRPADVSRQFTQIVGHPFLPPFATLGYHQSRWNYNDQKDVHQVHENFDENDIPMDVIWLDIEYTDGKRYFTWDSPKFPNPTEMFKNLTAKGRHLVLISDPHFKKDDDYFAYKEMLNKDFYVKTKDKRPYEGWCWPGASYYPDFLNPEVREYYAGLYSRETFKDAWTWNDMNEPSVFNGPEVTMFKDNLHYEDREHREIHNIYGMSHLLATFDGHLKRSDFKLRPFILTRSFFAGAQRLAAAWTGDNTADWGHLKVTNPMLLSLSLSGMTFVGADVGGFFRNPEAHLLVRWYQAAAFQPFFRAHAHIDTRRREPWLFEQQSMLMIRDAIRARYTFLPYWYTLFYQANQTGLPPMRPLFYEFPADHSTFAMENEYLIGDALLVHPVTEENAKSVEMYFPGDKTEVWYDITSLETYRGGMKVNLDTPMHKVPLFQRGGTIIPRRFRTRRSAILAIEDPITLSIAMNDKNTGKGLLYLDDGTTRDHLQGEFVYMEFTLENNILKSKILHSANKYKTRVWLERVFITGWKFRPSSIEIHELPRGEKSQLEFFFDEKHNILTVRKPAVNLSKEWAMVIRP